MNIGNNEEISISNLARLILKVLDRHIPLNFEQERADDLNKRNPNLDLALKILSPWSPKIGLETGLKFTSQYLKNNFS